MPKKQSDRAHKAGTVYRFKIDAFTPDTMPMARLSEYMAQLAVLLGEPSAVHFQRLERGSTVLVHSIEREAVPKVRARASCVAKGEAPRDAVRAYRAINKLLRDDNAVGLLRERKVGRAIIRFPGVEEAEERFVSVREHGSVDGTVIRVGGTDATIPVLLQAEDRVISGCYTEDRATAKRLAAKLFDPVRLWGKGRWSRDSEGTWSLVEFKVESFEDLSPRPLREAVNQLRTIESELDAESYGELRLIRHGPTSRRHGGD